MPLLIVLLPLVLIGLWMISTYNFFVSTKARIKASIEEIGNQLKRQADLIPNLESSAKGFLKHEKGIFKALTDARKEVSQALKSEDLSEMAAAGSKISQVLPGIKVAVEDNPEIKGAEVVKPLMDELRDTSDKVMYSRRLLIDLTADYNVARVSFPSSLIAKMFGFQELEGMKMATTSVNEVSEADTRTPEIHLE